jgi:hypothetical protein
MSYVTRNPFSKTIQLSNFCDISHSKECISRSFSRGRYQWEVGGHKERVNEGEYGGCILYSYMKIEEWNLLKLF